MKRQKWVVWEWLITRRHIWEAMTRRTDLAVSPLGGNAPPLVSQAMWVSGNSWDLRSMLSKQGVGEVEEGG